MNQDKFIACDLEEVEKAVMAKLATEKDTLDSRVDYGVHIGDRYQKYADENGITRAEAKTKMFYEDYGCSTGVKDWKKDLRKLIVKNG